MVLLSTINSILNGIDMLHEQYVIYNKDIFTLTEFLVTGKT